jgi:hypothetical protein
MKNLFCRMLWLDPTRFELRHPKDQSSIIKYGFAISMIVMIELFSGNYIAKSIFQISSPMSYVAAFMWAWIIYVTDVLIIRSPGKEICFSCKNHYWHYYCRHRFFHSRFIVVQKRN